MTQEKNQLLSPLEKNIIYDGTYFIGKNGAGYIRIRERPELITISLHKRATAFHRDRVKFIITSILRNFEFEGEIKEITNRATTGITGNYHYRDDKGVIVSDNTIEPLTVFIGNDKTLGAKDGDYVFSTINWGTVLTGEVTEILTKLTKNEKTMRVITRMHGFSEDFPEDVVKEAEEIARNPIPQSEWSYRRDMRSIKTCTIDPETARDFDDALSVDFKENGDVEVGIHIADVAHYVRPGTKLDEEAYRRATSVYLVDRCVPMLPEVLSNDICSLTPNTEKFAFSCIVTFTSDKKTIKDKWIGRTIIKSDKRYSYREAQEDYDNKTGDFVRELTFMIETARNLKEERRKDGAYMLEKQEIAFVLDEFGNVLDIKRKDVYETMSMIEEFMLVANRLVATYATLERKAEYFFYRIHDTPDPRKVHDLQVYMKALGVNATIVNGIIPFSQVEAVYKNLETDIQRDALSLSVARSMSKAIYTTENKGHFGLAFDYYTHFTSPIRRYPDVIVHRMLWDILHDKLPEQSNHELYIQAGEHTSQRENDAVSAERESIKVKQVEYISKLVGTKRNGMVTGFLEKGMFVRDLQTDAEGIIFFNSIRSDFYEYDQKNNKAIGRKTKKEFRLGDFLQIKIEKTNLERNTIDFTLVENKNFTEQKK